VIVALSAVLLQRQRLSRWTVAALGAAVSGSALLVLGAKGGVGHVGAAGVVAGLVAACSFAFYTIWSNRYVQKTDPWTVLVYALLCAALVWNVLRPSWVALSASYVWTTWLAFAFIAVFGTLLPFGAYLSSLQSISASHASITATLEPVVAGVVAFALLSEALVPLQLLGGAGIVAGVFMVQIDRRGQESDGRRGPLD
jgi:drug/metabolite transporter (DMT)-like permease